MPGDNDGGDLVNYFSELEAGMEPDCGPLLHFIATTSGAGTETDTRHTEAFKMYLDMQSLLERKVSLYQELF